MRTLIPLIYILLLGYLQSEGKFIQLLCGDNLKLYNPVEEACINGQVFKRTTTSAPTKSLSLPNRLLCGRNLHLYNPETQVCINGQVFERTTTASVKQKSTSTNSLSVETGPIPTPEQRPCTLLCIMYRCSNFDVYKRGSCNITRRDSAANDRSHVQTVTPAFDLISLVIGLPLLVFRI